MEFKIRKNAEYLDVSLRCEGTLIYLGLHNEKERKALAAVLLEAASELLEGLEDNIDVPGD